MVYLANKFAMTDWLPEDAVGAARVQRWLSVAAGQIAFGPAAARLITVFGSKSFRPDEVIACAHAVLKLIDAELRGRDFVAADRPTIADVALYSYIARAPEGNVDLSAYAAVRAWLKRVEALPGFVEFVKTPVGLAA
jgi:glutathione S-transferase